MSKDHQVSVMAFAVLSDVWGADEAFADGGAQAVVDLIHEDIIAFIEECDFSVVCKPVETPSLIQGETE